MFRSQLTIFRVLVVTEYINSIRAYVQDIMIYTEYIYIYALCWFVSQSTYYKHQTSTALLPIIISFCENNNYSVKYLCIEG